MSFFAAADGYDAFMGQWSRLLAPQLADLADVGPGARALDVGCGTGALAAVLLERVGASGEVVGVDPSEAFVAAVRERLPRVDVHQGRAEALPFPDGRFDRVLAQLVVHFMADPVAGIREMGRVTRPGGVVAACVWDHAGERGPLRAFWAAAREVEGDIDDESLLAGTREGHLAGLFEAAGLRDVRPTALVVRREYATFDDWWAPYTRGSGPAGAFLGRLDEPRREAIRVAAHHSLGDGPITVEGTAWAVRGTA